MPQNDLKDSRNLPVRRENLAVLNQSLVYEAFPDDQKLTMNEITDVIAERLKSQGQKPLSERTIRRAIDSLVTKGFIKNFGRQGNAYLYGKVNSSFAAGPENEKLITLAGNLVTVEDFLKMIVSPESDPLSVKVPIISDEMTNRIRRRLAFVILTAGEPGHNDELKRSSRELHGFIRELEHALSVLKTFVDSPVWYTQYRDRIGYEMRKVQERNPELRQLTVDYIRSEK